MANITTITRMMASSLPLYPVAGLDPATHVFFPSAIACREDVDARVKPGQGDFLVSDKPGDGI